MRHSLKLCLTLLVLTLGLTTHMAKATTVQFQTVLGDFEVNLFDNITPETVENFLAYVEAGDYTDTFFHRSAKGFVVQGGGFFYNYEDEKPYTITINAPVINEPKLSNQRGTIAMAKLGNNPNSATNQWFFNLADNSANLDNQNSGFTVFGQVTGNGMAIIDTIAALPAGNFGEAFVQLPIRNYTDEDIAAKTPLTHEHLALVHNIVVLDPSPDTAAGLNPKPTTRQDNNGGGSNPDGSNGGGSNPDGSNGGGSNSGGNNSSGGGGSSGFLLLGLLAGGLLARRLTRKASRA